MERKQKLLYSQLAWTETAETVTKEMHNRFPNLKNQLTVGKAVLAYLNHSKPHYRLGFVIPLKDFKTKREETIIYYPVKNVFLHFYQKMSFDKAKEMSEVIWTKRGNMQVVHLKDEEFAVSFTKIEITMGE